MLLYALIIGQAALGPNYRNANKKACIRRITPTLFETGYLFCCLFFFYTIPNYNIYYFSAKPLHYSFKATFFSWKINEIKFRVKLPGQQHAPHLGHLQSQHKLRQCQIWILYAQNSFPCLKNNALLILPATVFINPQSHKA